jgi:hypothetical protein
MLGRGRADFVYGDIEYMTLPTLNLSLVPAADGKQRISDPLGEYVPPPMYSTIYYVDPVDGNDSGGWEVDGSETNAAKSLQHVIDQGVLGPGVAIYLMAGTYWETPRNDNMYGKSCYILNASSSGAAGNPCAIQAAPGHEGKVIFDGQGPDGSYSYQQLAIYVGSISYIRLQGLIITRYGPVAIGFSRLAAANDPRCTVGWQPRDGIEVIDCVFADIIDGVPPSSKDGNPSAIRNDGTRGMLMRNCFGTEIYTVGDSSRGMLVQGFTIADLRCTQCTGWSLNSIAWPKQNSVSPEGKVWQIIEIDHCYTEDGYFGITWGQLQNEYCAHGHQQYHHNIVFTALGGKQNTSGLNNQQTGNASGHPDFGREFIQGRTDHYHNAAIVGGNSTYNSYQVNGIELHSVGNICWGGRGSCRWTQEIRNPREGLHESDYNVYGSPRSWELSIDGVYGNNIKYSSLTAWQAAQPGDSVSLGNMIAGQFDPNSVASNDKAECFVDWENRDLRLPEGSPLVGMMPDGTNPGPYQYGNDVQIGCRLPWIDLVQFAPDIPDWLNPGKGVLPLLPGQIPQGDS